MEKTYNVLEVFRKGSKTCDKKFTEWRPDMKDRLQRMGDYILTSERGKAHNWVKTILFFDVKEEDIETELINSGYKSKVISEI